MASMNTSEQIPYTLEFFLADGTTPAQVQAGSVVAASSDETVLRVVPDAGSEDAGNIISVAASDTPARVTFTADADLGNGVVTITVITEDITVTQDPATQAQTIRVTLGAPVPKTPAAPPPGP